MKALPELVILAPRDPALARKTAARMVELGIHFPFLSPGDRLPAELPDDLRGCKGVVLSEAAAPPLEARLAEFARSGGRVMRWSEDDWQKESGIERVAVRCALTLRNPAMRARREALADREVLEAALSWGATYRLDRWSDVLRHQIEGFLGAHALDPHGDFLDRAASLVERALEIAPRPADNCDHISCLAPILDFTEATGRRDLLGPCRRMAGEYLRSASRYRGVLSNFTCDNEAGLARAEIAFQVCPALARLGRHTGESRYADLAGEQILLSDEILRVEPSGLWTLGVGDGGRTPALWGRGAVFGFRGVVDTLAELGPAHPARERLLGIAQRMAAALRAFQQPEGTWRQVLDEPSVEMECSATAWATAGLAKAVRLGMLSPDYAECVRRGWLATKRNTWEGMPVNACQSVTASRDPEYYRHRPFLRPAPYGHFPAVAAVEFLRFQLAAVRFTVPLL
ncbi:MAG: glycoside hydrolase family 88 protein [Verrucomicrobiae bacterium]|nr:glycoside hydrolase family 88 protein [Verrucomicrobiae bacterium]